MAATAMATTEGARPPVHPLTDARHPAVRRVADVLRSRAANPTVFVIDDRENIEQAVESGVVLDSLYVTRAAVDREVSTLAGVGPDLPLYVVEESVARELFGEQKSARVFALARAPRPARLRDLVGVDGDVVVLDGVRIVGNIGAIARTACALGAAGLVLVDSGLRTVLDRRLIRASRGLVFAIPVVLASRTECIDFVRGEQLEVAALSADAAKSLNDIRAVDSRLALVLGGEREGVPSEWDGLTTHRYAIPMAANVESLNVSVAAAIALYEHTFR